MIIDVYEQLEINYHISTDIKSIPRHNAKFRYLICHDRNNCK